MLRFENVHVYYGQVHALKGITGEVHEGELVAPVPDFRELPDVSERVQISISHFFRNTLQT